MAFCTKCGHQVAQNATSCPSCGVARYGSGGGGRTAPAPRPTPRAQGALYCPNCGRNWGEGRSCQFCKQLEGAARGITLASPMRRLGAVLLEVIPLGIAIFVAFAVFAGVAGASANNDTAAGAGAILGLAVLGAYAFWALSVFRRGQTPGKYLAGIRVVRLDRAAAAGFGTMLLREWLAKPIIGLATAPFGIGLLADCWLLWDKDTQELWDKIVSTVVVNDRTGLTLGGEYR